MKHIIAPFLALLLSACSSLTSRSDNAGKYSGMVYFLPQKFVTLNLTVNGTGDRTVSIASSEALPDPTERYVARFNVSQIGANKLTVKTTASGLLSEESTTSSVSSLTDIFKSIAGDIGTTASVRANAAQPTPCGNGSAFSWIFDPTTENLLNPEYGYSRCGLKVRIIPMFDARTLGEKARGESPKGHQSSSGFFYRRPLPYLVTVTDSTGSGARYEKLLSLPTSQSPREFLPVSRSVFATNTGKFSFEDGMPKTYTQELDSELLGLVKLPAEVVSAYFTAVGTAFTNRKNALSYEQTYLQQLRSMEIEQIKLRSCMSAVATQNQTLIADACKP